MEKISVMSAEQYFQKYAENGIGKGADRWMIKRQMMDEIRRETFNLIADRTGWQQTDHLPEEGCEESRKVKAYVRDARNKWKKLCEMFSKFKETMNLIKPEDFKLFEKDA